MGGKPARGNRPTRTRDARASGVFRFFAFTSSPFVCKVLNVSVLRVKDLPHACSRRFALNRLKQSVLWVKASPRALSSPSFGHFARGRREGASGAAGEAQGEGKKGA